MSNLESSSDDRDSELPKTRVEPIPDKTRAELLEETKEQLNRLFCGEDISNLTISDRRQRGRGYSSIDELISHEFDGGEGTGMEKEQSRRPSVELPISDKDKKIKDGGERIEHTIFNENYKMVLKNTSSGVKETYDLKEHSLSWGLKKKKLSITKNLKKMKRFEACKKMLQQSIDSQLKALQIESHSRCIFSLGKHLYSNTAGGKLRLRIGSEPLKPLSPPLVKSFRKLQEWTIYQRAALLASRIYTLAQEICTDACTEEEPQNFPATNYLAFFEEGFLLKLQIKESNFAFVLASLQVYASELLAEGTKKETLKEISTLADSLKISIGGELRLGDLLRLVQNSIKKSATTKLE